MGEDQLKAYGQLGFPGASLDEQKLSLDRSAPSIQSVRSAQPAIRVLCLKKAIEGPSFIVFPKLYGRLNIRLFYQHCAYPRNRLFIKKTYVFPYNFLLPHLSSYLASILR